MSSVNFQFGTFCIEFRTPPASRQGVISTESPSVPVQDRHRAARVQHRARRSAEHAKPEAGRCHRPMSLRMAQGALSRVGESLRSCPLRSAWGILGALRGLCVHGAAGGALPCGTPLGVSSSRWHSGYRVPGDRRGSLPLGIKLTRSGYDNRLFMYHWDIPSM